MEASFPESACGSRSDVHLYDISSEYPANLAGGVALDVWEHLRKNTIAASTEIAIRGICVEITTKGLARSLAAR